MNLLACSIYDAAVGAFLTPFHTRSKGEAIRAFSDSVNDKNSPFNAHPSDFSLFILSTWNDADGRYEPVGSAPERLIVALDVLQQPKLDASF